MLPAPRQLRYLVSRVWAPFLTDSDRQWVEMRGKQPIGFGERPALLMIDLYRGGFGDRPEPLVDSMKRWPWSCGMNGWRAAPHIATLLGAARAAQLPIVHSTMRDSRDGLQGWLSALHGVDGALSRAEDETGVEQRAKQLVEEFAPRQGEAVVEKAGPSAFWGTPLIGHFITHRIDTVVVAGMATSGCVRATVVDGAAYRLRMMVVESCVFDRVDASHAMALFDIEHKYGDVISLDCALAAMGASVTPLSHSGSPERQ